MAYDPFPQGQKVMASSRGVVIASNQTPISVAGTLGSSIIGLTPVSIAGIPQVEVVGSVAAQMTPSANQSVSGTVNVGNLPTNQNVSGSVIARNILPSSLLVGASVVGLTPVSIAGIPQVEIIGSVAAQMTPPANQSISGTTGSSIVGHAPVVIVGGSILTSSTPNQSVSGTVNVGNLPTTQNVSGSVAAWLQSTNASVITVGTPAANQSVSGTVGASVIGTIPTTQAGTWITSLVSTVPSSVIVGASIFGLAPVTLGATRPSISGAVNVNQVGTWRTSVVGSVATLQGTNPWISRVVDSVASAIINVPQVSVHGTVRLAQTSMVSGHGSVNGAASVLVLTAPGVGLYNYVTDFLLSNTGAATTLVTFTDTDGSVLGKSIAPTGGGAVAAGLATPMRTMQTNKGVNVVAGTATSVLHAWIGGFIAP